jgi:hypothetical protein
MPKGDQQRGLFRKDSLSAIVPDNVIGSFHFFFERHLRFDHGFSCAPIDAHPLDQPRELNVRRGSNDHHSVTQGLTTRFIEKWNVCDEKFGRLAVLFRLSTPLPTNPRMENFLERAFLGRVLEDYSAKRGPIQVPIGRKNAEPELIQQLLFNFLNLDEFMRGPIGVEKPGGGKNLSQTLAKKTLARGNPARNPDRRHVSVIHWPKGGDSTEKKRPRALGTGRF